MSSANGFVTGVAALVLLLWLLLAIHRVYGQFWAKIPLKGIILEAGYFIVGEALAVLTLGLAFLMIIRSHGG
ncbi:MAG: hypothetical protein M3Q46_04900 [Verrucomicrobiota bacterium]|nr:hypothetical protein [Verrucomicrobiota bacterium]